MFNPFCKLLFSFAGRMPRFSFWLVGLLAWGVFAVLFLYLKTVFGYGSTWALYPPLLWVVAAASTRRMHDRGISAWMFLIVLVPLLGPLWLFIELGLRRGSAGENQYGPDPLDTGVDYLTVG